LQLSSVCISINKLSTAVIDGMEMVHLLPNLNMILRQQNHVDS